MRGSKAPTRKEGTHLRAASVAGCLALLFIILASALVLVLLFAVMLGVPMDEWLDDVLLFVVAIVISVSAGLVKHILK